MRRAAALLLALALAACAVPRVQPPGPGGVGPSLADGTYRTADGMPLPARIWLPEGGAPRAALIALHGFNDYSNAFAEPAEHWRAEGIAVYAYDQRGFGRAPYRGQWPGGDALIGDLIEFAALVRARHPGLPLYVLGDSMGGAVAMVAAAERAAELGADGLILVAPAVWGRETMPLAYSASLWLGAHTLPWATLSGRGLKIRASDNIEMLKALGRDPLVIKHSRIDAIYGLVGLMDRALARAAEVPGPALVLYGANDQIIPKTPTRRMLAAMPAGARTIAVYGDGWHMLLRDLNAAVVRRDIAHWMAQPGAPLPSGAEANAGAFLVEEAGR